MSFGIGLTIGFIAGAIVMFIVEVYLYKKHSGL
jgi:hypothetical protein